MDSLNCSVQGEAKHFSEESRKAGEPESKNCGEVARASLSDWSVRLGRSKPCFGCFDNF